MRSEAHETSFTCEGHLDYGFYADPETDCQSFHGCIPDGQGGLDKQTFLCPNGTVYSEELFICDWWYNVDCHGGLMTKARAASVDSS